MRRNQSALLGLAGAALALAGAGYATRAPRQDSAGWPATTSVPEIDSARSGIGARLAWGDVDGDRLPDAVAVRADGGLSLFRNAGDGTLSEATEQSGLADVTGARVALLEDFDGDGLADLFLGGAAGSRLLVSMGAGFAEITEGSGLAGLADVRAARTLDYDADGRPDLAVTTPRAELLFHNTASGRFEPVDLLSLAEESAVTVVSPPPVGPPPAGPPSAEEPPT